MSENVIGESGQDTAAKISRAMAEPPSWQANGGIRGEQNDQAKSYTELPDGQVRREPRQPAFPADESTSGESETDTIDVYGAYNAQPALFHLLQSSPPTPL